MPLGLEAGSSPWPHSLVLCYSLWSTPVSIPHAFNLLHTLSKPLNSWLMYSNDLVFSLNSATILWSQLRTELSTWGWWMNSRCAEMWTPSAPGAATGWSTSSRTTHPKFFHCAKQMWLFSKCSLTKGWELVIIGGYTISEILVLDIHTFISVPKLPTLLPHHSLLTHLWPWGWRMATEEGGATSRRNLGPQMTMWGRGTSPAWTLHLPGMVLPCSMILHLEVSLL